MRIKTFVSILVCCVFASNVNAEATPGEWDVRNVGDQINTQYHDSWSTITEDGLTLYFGSNRPGGFVKYNSEDGWAMGADGTPTKYDMYVAHRDSIDAPWGKPILLPSPINTEHNEHSAAVSPDGHYLFFASGRPGGCGDLDLYVSYREDVNDDLAWQAPKHLGCQEEGGVNTANIDSCPIHHFDEKEQKTKLYFTASSTPNPATLDFKFTVFDEKNMTASIPETINISTKDYLDGHIDPKHGYVWAAYPTGLGGSDIWQSKHDEQSGEWQTPVNLGASINTKDEEQLPSPFADGASMIFPSNRPGGYGGFDIYEASKQ